MNVELGFPERKIDRNSSGLLTSAVWSFAARMLKQLMLNRHKVHWRQCPIEFLEDKLQARVNTLLSLLQKPGNQDKVWDAAADLSNYSMMVADKNRDAVKRLK